MGYNKPAESIIPGNSSYRSTNRKPIIIPKKQFSYQFRILNNHLQEKSPVSLGSYSFNPIPDKLEKKLMSWISTPQGGINALTADCNHFISNEFFNFLPFFTRK
jgi:hypothetical protein